MWYTLEEFLGNFTAFKRQKNRCGWHGNYLDYLVGGWMITLGKLLMEPPLMSFWSNATLKKNLRDILEFFREYTHTHSHTTYTYMYRVLQTFAVPSVAFLSIHIFCCVILLCHEHFRNAHWSVSFCKVIVKFQYSLAVAAARSEVNIYNDKWIHESSTLRMSQCRSCTFNCIRNWLQDTFNHH